VRGKAFKETWRYHQTRSFWLHLKARSRLPPGLWALSMIFRAIKCCATATSILKNYPMYLPY
jgi:hypothetical protein